MTYKMTLALALLTACSTGPSDEPIVVYRTVQPAGDDDDDKTDTDTPRGDDDDSPTGTNETGDTGFTVDTDTDTGTPVTTDTGTVITDTGTVGTSLGFPVSPLPDFYFTKHTTFDIDEPLPNSNDIEGELFYRGSDGVVRPSPPQPADPFVIEAELMTGPVDANDCQDATLDPSFAFTTTGIEPDLEEGAWLCVQSREGKRVAMAVVMDWTDTLVVRVYE